MKKFEPPFRRVGMLALLVLCATGRAELLLNEILFNPPGMDAPNEYIELRGTPNVSLPAGTYLIAVTGDATGNPGVIKNVFDLSGKTIGGNGLLVLLQKGHAYNVNTNATALANTDTGAGFGSGSSSSIDHKGANGQTDLEHPPVTFLLLQTTNPPAAGADIDADNNGTLDTAIAASWTILDSVGVLSGNGDIGYGAINFRKNPSGVASGTIVPVTFTPNYVGRAGDTTGSAAADWVASGALAGAAPVWSTGDSANTVPSGFANLPLNHLGSPNFGAPALPGILVLKPGGSLEVAEGGATAVYSIALNSTPSGPVTIQIAAGLQLEASVNGGISFGAAPTLTFANSTPRTVIVRAIDDNVVDVSPRKSSISHSVVSSGDPAGYPVTSIIPKVKVNLTDNDTVLLNELKVNPPGPIDAPYQFFEIAGAPNAMLSNVYLLVINGNIDGDPGTASLVVNLSNMVLGSSGLLCVVGRGQPYSIPPGTTVATNDELGSPGISFGKGAFSFLLLTSPSPIVEGDDLDGGNNGVLEGLAPGTTILDAVGWSDGDTNDVVYGGVTLSQSSATPDAATRFPGNNTPQSAGAWFFAELAGPDAASLIYDSGNARVNFPVGAILSPGGVNDVSISISRFAPLSGVIGDPTNPTVSFQVASTHGGAATLTATASSSNPAVVPDANLNVRAGTGGSRTLSLNPDGVGYATITVTVQGGGVIGQTTFPYAASAGGRPGGRFHTSASDGSTAIAVDANYMFVGDDENQVLRLYDRNRSGPPLSEFDFRDFLDLTAQNAGEVDIEASTRVGNRLFWMGSHSHSSLGESRTNRNRVFATDLSVNGAASTLAYVGRYNYLKTDLINWDTSNAHGKGTNYYGFAASDAEGVNPKADDGSGFNIEGLSMAPGSATVGWICFRAPLAPATNRAKALIVPVLNFATLAISGAGPGAAVFGAPIELNLGCRGIRSIEASSNAVLISAGPPGGTTGVPPNDFRLFTWTGNPSDQPQERAADLSGLNPEGIVELSVPPWTPDSQVQLISDNGTMDYYNDGMEAKHLLVANFKKFRSDWVTLGPVVVSRPVIRFLTISGGNLILSWCSVAGVNYHVQWKSNLSDLLWTDLAGDVLATDAVASKIIPLGTLRQRFFRLMVVP